METCTDLTFLTSTVAFLSGCRAWGARKKWWNIQHQEQGPQWQLWPSSGIQLSGPWQEFPRSGEDPAWASQGALSIARMGLWNLCPPNSFSDAADRGSQAAGWEERLQRVLGISRPWLSSWLSLSGSVTSASHYIVLSLSFFLFEVEIIIPTSWGCTSFKCVKIPRNIDPEFLSELLLTSLTQAPLALWCPPDPVTSSTWILRFFPTSLSCHDGHFSIKARYPFTYPSTQPPTHSSTHPSIYP